MSASIFRDAKSSTASVSHAPDLTGLLLPRQYIINIYVSPRHVVYSNIGVLIEHSDLDSSKECHARLEEIQDLRYRTDSETRIAIPSSSAGQDIAPERDEKAIISDQIMSFSSALPGMDCSLPESLVTAAEDGPGSRRCC